MVLRKDLLVTFLLIVVAPFCVFIHFSPLGDFWPFFIACSTVVVCTIISLGVASFKQHGMLISPLIIGITGFFLFLCLLTVVQKVSLNDQISLLIYSVLVILAALLAMQLAQQNEVQYYDYLAFVLVMGGLIEAFGAIAIQYRLVGIDYWMVPVSNRLIGFIAQSNQLAIYMMVAFLALSYLTFRKICPVIIAIIISGLFGFVLLGSGSRAVFIYLLIAVIFSLFCLFKSKDKVYLRFIFCLLALIVGAIIYYYLATLMSWFGSDSTQTTTDAALAYSRSTTSESFRLSEINKAFALFKGAPLIGVGYGNYAVEGFWLGVNDGSYTFIGDLTLHSHNLFAQVMAEFGLFGLFGLFALFGYITVCFWRTPKTLQWWLVLCVCLVYFVNSMLEYVLWRMHFVPLLVLVMVPLLSRQIKLSLPRLVGSIIWIFVGMVFIFVANSSLTVYAKSFFYNKETLLLDTTDYKTFQSATKDLLWGRDIQLDEFVNLSPQITDFANQQKITDEMLMWRPYAPVIVNKIQLSLLSGQLGDLSKLSNALAKAYPNMVPSICNYFKDFTHIPNLQGLRIVKKELNCRAFTSIN